MPKSTRFLGRPKTFLLHKDAYQYYPDDGMLAETITRVHDSEIESVNAEMGTEWYPHKPRPFYRRVRAQFNDPFCVFAVLDALVRSQRGIYIRPYYLLNDFALWYPQYYWEAGIIGRIMSAVCLIAETEYDEVEKTEAPFARGRDARGKYYVVDPKGGDEGLLWLLRCRQLVMDICDEIMGREATGDFSKSLVKAIQPAAIYIDWFTGHRPRPVGNYVAQMRPGVHFKTSTERDVNRHAIDPFR